jgi:glycosyltransferase involved in cell wall biosynthesis
MRIAIVGPNYFLDRSYQENVWAEQLVKSGHEVCVVCGAQQTERLTVAGPTGDYRLSRVPMRVLPPSVHLERGAADAVAESSPDLIVVFGDKLFSRRIATDQRIRGVPMVATFSENPGMHEYDWRKPCISLRQRYLALGFAVLRSGPIRTICRRSVLLVGNTPKTREIVLRLIPRSERSPINAKFIDRPLGFSPEHYGFDPELRRKVRDSLGVSNEQIVFCTSSRFDPIKEASIRLMIDAARRLMPAHPHLRALIIGFSRSETSGRVRQFIDVGPFAERFIQEPFADRGRLNELFNASDIIAYNLATISCQEALGTGLYSCLSDIGAMDHLLQSPEQGSLYRPDDADDLARCIERGMHMLERLDPQARLALRSRMADEGRWLGYDRIIASILDEVRQRMESAARTQA